jgi:O-antigen ligase
MLNSVTQTSYPKTTMGQVIVTGIILVCLLIPFIQPLPVPGIRISVADIVMALSLGLWFIYSITQKQLSKGLENGQSWPGSGIRWLAAVMCVYIAANVLSGVVSEAPLIALKEVLQLTLLFGFFWVVLTQVQSTDQVQLAMWALALSAVLITIPAIADSLAGRGPDLFDDIHTRAYGMLGQPNALGSYLGAVLFPLCGLWVGQWQQGRHRYRLWLYGAAIGILWWGILLTMSRGTWLAAAVVMTVFVLLYALRSIRAKAVLLLLLVISTALMFGKIDYDLDQQQLPRYNPFTARMQASGNDFSSEQRIYLAQAALSMTRTHPVLGVGPGQYGEHLLEYAPAGLTDFQNMPHNIFAQVASETGVVGLMPFLALIIIYAYIALKGLSVFSADDPYTYWYCGLTCGVLFIIVSSQLGTTFAHGVQEPWMIMMALSLVLLQRAA